MAGTWKSCIVLARWYGLASSKQLKQKHRQVRLRNALVWPDWPDTQWLREMAAEVKSASVPAHPPFSPDALRQLADSIRSWAPAVLSSASTEEARLSAAVTWLDHCARKLAGERLLHERAALYRCSHSAIELIRSLHVSRCLRSVEKLRQVTGLAVEARWPGLFDLSNSKGLQISSWGIYRAGLIADVSLLLLQQKRAARDEAEACVRFAWADSTDLRGRQMLLARHVCIGRSALYGTMVAAHMLSWDRRFAEREQMRERQRLHRFEMGVDDVDSGALSLNCLELQHRNFGHTWVTRGYGGGGMRNSQVVAMLGVMQVHVGGGWMVRVAS